MRSGDLASILIPIKNPDGGKSEVGEICLILCKEEHMLDTFWVIVHGRRLLVKGRNLKSVSST